VSISATTCTPAIPATLSSTRRSEWIFLTDTILTSSAFTAADLLESQRERARASERARARARERERVRETCKYTSELI
jgi:hypothetical protein